MADAFTRRVRTAVVVAAAILLVLVFVWQAAFVLLLIFAGILGAIVLGSLADLVVRALRLPRGVALALVIVVPIGLLGGFGLLVYERVSQQVDMLAEEMPRAIDHLAGQLETSRVGKAIVDRAESLEDNVFGQGRFFTRTRGVLSSLLDVLVHTLVVVVLAIYIAAEPRVYERGLVRLVSQDRREQAARVLADVTATLRWWLFGKAISMVTVGALTLVGLLLLGMPMALTLALLTGALSFVPNLGPVASAVPPILLALPIGGVSLALGVVALYVGVQLLESYLITPLVMRKAVDLPPAMTLSAQVLLGVFLGLVGVLFAAPLMATAIVLVRRLYVEEVLGDDEGEVPEAELPSEYRHE